MRTGKGVPQDRVLAHMWFSLAAAQGSELAGAFLTDLTKQMPPPRSPRRNGSHGSGSRRESR